MMFDVCEMVLGVFREVFVGGGGSLVVLFVKVLRFSVSKVVSDRCCLVCLVIG